MGIYSVNLRIQEACNFIKKETLAIIIDNNNKVIVNKNFNNKDIDVVLVSLLLTLKYISHLVLVFQGSQHFFKSFSLSFPW